MLKELKELGYMLKAMFLTLCWLLKWPAIICVIIAPSLMTSLIWGYRHVGGYVALGELFLFALLVIAVFRYTYDTGDGDYRWKWEKK